ncbi:hypothetical protein A3H26_03770 [candidate division WWE3 bacterium RIFCSPLOWO2_12_FULL_36_10]|uniref:nucleoside-diphosphate kinase n=1 Tax=candidate division WWE3 bacterium RIFCSPLOWO2_12_FULL_36_10 TaxID=1802630 RepID=A0A1F4VGF6_UNCKA|nr:MAG: hypothetical protein A3H26_03770 [candidate division WWE3 bacterium RIFCSPLOWO2_12_FULL_36_10]
MIEQSLVLIKPDGVKRGLVGEILHRLERAGLKIVAAKFTNVSEDLGLKHYAKDDEWKKIVGKRNIDECEELGLKVNTVFGTTDPVKIGTMVVKRNADFLSSGPVLVFVMEGPNAVAKIRSLVGPTFPNTASVGTIRGDFGLDSSYVAALKKRTTYNLIHASGTVGEAKDEIKLWFKPKEILSYRRVHEDLYMY